MPKNPAESRLTGILALCLAELMDELGAEPVWLSGWQPSDESEEMIAAAVGFRGDKLCGSIVLAGQPRAFARLYPFPTSIKSPDLADWAREMANQGVGRFRNRALAHGLTIYVGVPETVSSLGWRIAKTRKLIEIPMALGIGDMRLEALVEFGLGPDFELDNHPVTEKGPALPEGSVVLFQNEDSP